MDLSEGSLRVCDAAAHCTTVALAAEEAIAVFAATKSARYSAVPMRRGASIHSSLMAMPVSAISQITPRKT